MNEFNSIKNWLEDDRPREKMIQKGASALTDAELLAILIATGSREKSAVGLAREVLELAHNNLRELGRLGVQELQKINGIGPAKAITISAAMELGRRRQISEGLERMTLLTSIDAVDVIMPLLQDLNHEAFFVMYLNHANKLIKTELVSNGGLTSTIVDIRIILKSALLYSACKLIIAHNHPAGSKQPSAADMSLTRKLSDSALLMDIELIDHIIIAGNEYLSMKDDGYF